MPDSFAARPHYPGAVSEFFTVRTVAEARAGFRPAHRTAVVRMAVADALGLAIAAELRSPCDLPGFARSAVDGYAVRAADTHGVREGSPAHLAVTGTVLMGELPSARPLPGEAFAIPTGGALPEGADAVVMIEHTAAADRDGIELARPAAVGDNVVKADDDVAAGSVLALAGQALRPALAGLLAAAGVTELDVHAAPVASLISTGDEVVDASTAPVGAQVRDANAASLSALVRELGGRPLLHGIVPDDPAALARAAQAALAGSDLLVISAGSSVGSRDATAEVVAGLGAPGVWCHGLALKPGKPTLLADVGGKPVIGLPGNPVSALVVLRLIGEGVIRRAGGHRTEPVRATVAATLDRNVPSATGRLDVVQIQLEGDIATPLFGKAARLSVVAGADGYIEVNEDSEGLAEGARVAVVPYR